MTDTEAAPLQVHQFVRLELDRAELGLAAIEVARTRAAREDVDAATLMSYLIPEDPGANRASRRRGQRSQCRRAQPGQRQPPYRYSTLAHGSAERRGSAAGELDVTELASGQNALRLQLDHAEEGRIHTEAVIGSGNGHRGEVHSARWLPLTRVFETSRRILHGPTARGPSQEELLRQAPQRPLPDGNRPTNQLSDSALSAVWTMVSGRVTNETPQWR